MLDASVATMAEEQDDPTLMIGAYNLLAGTLYYFGDIVTGHFSISGTRPGSSSGRDGKIPSGVEAGAQFEFKRFPGRSPQEGL